MNHIWDVNYNGHDPHQYEPVLNFYSNAGGDCLKMNDRSCVSVNDILSEYKVEDSVLKGKKSGIVDVVEWMSEGG